MGGSLEEGSRKFELGEGSRGSHEEGSRKFEQGEVSRGSHGSSLNLSRGQTARGKGKEEVQPQPPLPAHLISIRKSSFSVFVANLLPQISKLEIKAMFLK